MSLNIISDLRQSEFDTITITYPSGTVEVYTHRKGGTTGDVAFTLTLTYSNASKQELVSVERNPKRT